MRQSGHWKGATRLKEKDLQNFLEKRIATVDMAALKREVNPFLRHRFGCSVDTYLLPRNRPENQGGVAQTMPRIKPTPV